MCGNCKKGHSKKCSSISSVAKVLVIIGGINWGIVGVGMLIRKDLNLINILLGSMPTVLNIIYLLVGLSALMMIFKCKCKKCENCVNGVCEGEKIETQGNM